MPAAAVPAGARENAAGGAVEANACQSLNAAGTGKKFVRSGALEKARNHGHGKALEAQ